MSTDSGTGRGGTAMFASPSRALRGVAFAPAVRGYPGGIADMAGDQEDFEADEPLGDDQRRAVTTDAESGDTTAPAGRTSAGPEPPQPAVTQPRQAQPEPDPVSVWQQSAAAWQEAGIDWLRPGSAGAQPQATSARAASARVRPAGRSADDDDPHTEPIPVVAADEAPAEAAGPGPRAVPEGAGTGRTAGQAGAGGMVGGAATGGPVAGGAGSVTAGQAGAGGMVGGAATGGPVAGGAGSVAAGGDAVRGTGAGRGVVTEAPGRTGRGEAATPERARSAGARQGRRARSAGARRGRRAAVGAAAALVLIAATFAGIGIARSGQSRPAGPEFRLVTPYSPAAPADTAFASAAAGATPMPASLTGIAAAGQTVVAIGAQPSQPAPVPLILLSTDGGRTWSRATLASPGAMAAPGATAGAGGVPAMVAHDGATWLALGQHTAWTSPDGKVWQPAPRVATAAGDTVLALTGTGTGFVAVGGHTGTQPGPAVWTSTDGRTWQRRNGPGPAARGGHAAALRWVASRGGVIVAGGPVTGEHRPAAGVWRSTDGGRNWASVTLPATHGATGALAGLAATGSTFVAVRPGHAGAGRQDAVTYRSGQGTQWRFAGRLSPLRRTSMRVIAVTGSSHGFALAATTHSGQMAFFSAGGRGWRQTADPGSGLAGLTAGPGGRVVVAGNSRPGAGAPGTPHLLLTSAGQRQQVGQPVLAAAATPDVTIGALATAGRTQVAAGAAGGAPALWLAAPGGQWAPGAVLLPVPWRNGGIVSVVGGGSGWLAVGQAGTRAPYQPVILTSATGRYWTPASGTGPLTAAGTSVAQAAAGPAGYVVVGSTLAGGRPVPAAWSSADLNTWARGSLTSQAASGQMLAVTAARSGFVAAGAAGSSPAVWTSAGGSAWRLHSLPRPPGAASAVLTRVTAAGERVVAVGYESRGAASAGAPFAAVSADGGRTWRESHLPAPPVPTVVTALTAAGHGFVAVGRAGPPGRPGMLAWWSADGLTWHHAGPTGGGRPGPFVTQINALTAGNGTLTGAGFAASGSAEHPVLWHARYR